MGRYSAVQYVSVSDMGRYGAAQYHTVESVSVSDMGRYSAAQKLRQFTALGLAGGTVCGGILLFKVPVVFGFILLFKVPVVLGCYSVIVFYPLR